ncbi:MAG: PAS domain S-box protein [Candidatus Micrarchaeota archaeon]
MKTSHTGSESKTPYVALRRRAEGIARGKAIRIPENMESLSIEATRQMLHELRVHQIELEIQNEELRRAQTELDAARARYFDLYDLAPVGYCTLSEKGLILEANLMATSLLGVARGALVKQPISRFILKDDQDIYYLHHKQLFDTDEPQACELRMVKMDGTTFWAHLAATAAQDAGGATVCRVVLSDITERKRAEDREWLAREVLDLLNRTEAAEDTIHDILAAVKKTAGFDAVAIRLREGDDFPYYTNKGFSEDFVLAERFLCARDQAGEIVHDVQGNPVLECMCGNILCGRTNPALPFFTEAGSFWSNCTTRLLASTTETDRQARTRTRCNSAGYESVALIPLRANGEIIGLLQLNDHRLNQFTLEMIRFFEGLGGSIGIALSRKRAEEGMRVSEENFRLSLDESPLGIRTVTKEGETIYANQATLNIFGYDSVEEWQTTPTVKRYTEQSYAEFKVRREK